MSINPNWPDEKPKKAGMNKTVKVLLWLFGGFVILGLLCCGGGIYFFYGGISEDPTVVAKSTQEIVDWEVPQDISPLVAINWKPFVLIVSYEIQPSRGILIMAEAGSAFASADKQQLETQIRSSMQGQEQRGAKNLQIEEQQTQKVTIRGQESDFVFAKAKDPESGKEMWQVTGAFQGKGGVAFILLQVNRDDYTEEELKELIGSIK